MGNAPLKALHIVRMDPGTFARRTASTLANGLSRIVLARDKHEAAPR